MGYFCKEPSSHELSKIAQSGHTDYNVASLENSKFLYTENLFQRSVLRMWPGGYLYLFKILPLSTMKVGPIG